jgi:hypothetical protein
MLRKLPIALVYLTLFGVFLTFVQAGPARAVDRAKLLAFLDVTGFDVALDSIALSAASAPQMLGLEKNPYGADWKRVSQDVFDKDVMRSMALEIMQSALSNELLDHGAAFYASELGQRLVAVENAAHMDDSLETEAAGRNLVIAMAETGDARLDLLRRLNTAVDPQDIGLKAVQEVQVRFLMAAAASGVYEMDLGEDELGAVMKAGEAELKAVLDSSALAGSAITYRDFSDEDISAYIAALEHPDMTTLYELMNAVQYEIMANRFEVLAYRMAELHPGQEL